ncbi:hypothetical protein BFF78_21480 [Streptomyces fodineus]|uniref:Uncharacterized protein n=1 Tax=Streptomyces fodineus TaxID=1904616 RepID=A0A1D7YCL2_9ACTN|nr:hypothetical protein [Streptomyces fodineus]AOR33301.1 hypothetical protein BFF78_21480 [Streptomyces fodineus]
MYEALTDFWEAEGYRLVLADPKQKDFYTLHEEHNGWTVLDWTRGWEWDLRRRAQFHVSRVYDCPGLLTFMYDGDYWGYELFHHGVEVDQFVQWADADQCFFDDRPVGGRPELLVEQFPDLRLDLDHVRGYLTSYSTDDPAYEDFLWDDDDPRNRPVREGDAWGRLDGGAIFDFWSFLGAEHHSGPGCFPPAWRRFTTEPQ